MPDMFVQDILDPEEIEKRDAWNKRKDLPVLINLDNYFQETHDSDTLLSGEFVQKINPDSYRISNKPESCDLSKLIEDLQNSDHFSPAACLLIDGTGYRNDLSDNVLPSNIIILNRKTDSDLSSSIKTIITTLFGNKGIGKRSKDQDFGFSKDNPFYIFVCAFNDEELRQYMNEVSETIKDFQDSLIKIVGFLVPKVG